MLTKRNLIYIGIDKDNNLMYEERNIVLNYLKLMELLYSWEKNNQSEANTWQQYTKDKTSLLFLIEEHLLSDFIDKLKNEPGCITATSMHNPLILLKVMEIVCQQVNWGEKTITHELMTVNVDVVLAICNKFGIHGTAPWKLGTKKCTNKKNEKDKNKIEKWFWFTVLKIRSVYLQNGYG